MHPRQGAWLFSRPTIWKRIVRAGSTLRLLQVSAQQFGAAQGLNTFSSFLIKKFLAMTGERI